MADQTHKIEPNGPGRPMMNTSGIVSVNDRGGPSRNIAGKVVFVVAVLAVMAVGGVVTYNKFNSDAKVQKALAAAAAKDANTPAAATDRRQFSRDAPPLPTPVLVSTVIKGPTGPNAAANGSVVPALDPTQNTAPPIPGAGSAGAGAAGVGQVAHNSRYGGDVLLSGGQSSPLRTSLASDGAAENPMNNPMMMMALAQSMAGQGQAGSTQPSGTQAQTVSGTNPPGSVGSMLRSSEAPRVMAGMIGDRNMVLPQGRSIACGMSMKIVSDVAGLTSCVLSQNVYSDNGRVVLLERGSEATGEYRATVEQGQRRLFVIWTRIKTPTGVVINLESPGADSLGTSGLPGVVDNHWWARVGGAFLLSTVKDAIAYQLASKSQNSAGGAVLYQNTATTGDQMAQKVLDSTINIRPTLYINQGDRASIYVARDLDFGSVYELRAR